MSVPNGYGVCMETNPNPTIATLTEIVLLERIDQLREEVAEAMRAARKAATASHTADRAEKRLRRILVRAEQKAGLVTPNGNSTSCTWTTEVPSGHPEPDSEADCWKFVECGAPARDIVDGWECENGHHYFNYGSNRQRVQEREQALAERRDGR